MPWRSMSRRMVTVAMTLERELSRERATLIRWVGRWGRSSMKETIVLAGEVNISVRTGERRTRSVVR